MVRHRSVVTGEKREDVLTERVRVAEFMTPAKIAEAQRLAREWDAAHPRGPHQAVLHQCFY